MARLDGTTKRVIGTRRLRPPLCPTYSTAYCFEFHGYWVIRKADINSLRNSSGDASNVFLGKAATAFRSRHDPTTNISLRWNGDIWSISRPSNLALRSSSWPFYGLSSRLVACALVVSQSSDPLWSNLGSPVDRATRRQVSPKLRACQKAAHLFLQHSPSDTPVGRLRPRLVTRHSYTRWLVNQRHVV